MIAMPDIRLSSWNLMTLGDLALLHKTGGRRCEAAKRLAEAIHFLFAQGYGLLRLASLPRNVFNPGQPRNDDHLLYAMTHNEFRGYRL